MNHLGSSFRVEPTYQYIPGSRNILWGGKKVSLVPSIAYLSDSCKVSTGPTENHELRVSFRGRRAHLRVSSIIKSTGTHKNVFLSLVGVTGTTRDVDHHPRW